MPNFHKSLIQDVILAAGIIGLLGLISFANSNTEYKNKKISILENNWQVDDCNGYTFIENNSPISYIPCEVLFNIHKFGICLDIPDYYYNLNPRCYDKVKIYFNLRPGVNYTKAGVCQYDDIQLTINKMNYSIVNVFWLVL